MKQLYKTTKVIYNAHLHQYEVYYKNWFSWKHEQSYKYDVDPTRIVHYSTKSNAEQRAIERAKAMLETVEVWRQSNYFWQP